MCDPLGGRLGHLQEATAHVLDVQPLAELGLQVVLHASVRGCEFGEDAHSVCALQAAPCLDAQVLAEVGPKAVPKNLLMIRLAACHAAETFDLRAQHPPAPPPQTPATGRGSRRCC